MKQLLITIVIAYTVLCVLLFLLQRKLLYFPQPASPVSLSEQVQAASFQSGPINLQGWVINPQASKALIYYGGNAEQIEQNIRFFVAMDLPYRVYLIPYRGYGHNEGAPSEQALYQDALAIYDRIKTEVDSVSLMGRSLGSGVATYVAANRDPDKEILVTPYDSIENVAKQAYPIFPISLLIKDRYRSCDRANDIAADTLILAAARDRVIRPERTRVLASCFEASKLKMITIEDADHNDIGLYPEYFELIRKWLR